MTDLEFRDLAQLVSSQFGIHLDRKETLVTGRLHKVLKSRGLTSIGEYLRLVRQDASGLALEELIDRISTNHTFFFREPEHFAFLQEVALGEIQHRTPVPSEVRLWCAGCATGEEAYTLAMLCLEWADENSFPGRFRIEATDISVTALETARKGEYNNDRVRLVPLEMKSKYFNFLGDERWAIVPALRSMISFHRVNFMDPSFPFPELFHMIFCRNVMIYFDRETKNALVQRLVSHLMPEHYLFVGHSEALGRHSFDLETVKPSVYRRKQTNRTSLP